MKKRIRNIGKKNKRSIIKAKNQDVVYPKIFKISFKLGLFFTFYSCILVLSSLFLKNDALAYIGISLFFGGFAFISAKLFVEERRVLDQLNRKKAK